MISITSKITDTATAKLKRLNVDLIKKLELYMKGEGADMEREIKQSLSKGGRTAGGGVVHSEPGQSPFVQSGRLRASIDSEVKVKDNEVTLDIGAIRGGKEVNYARDLELGRSNMAPRPYLMPKVIKYFDKFKKFFNSKMIIK